MECLLCGVSFSICICAYNTHFFFCFIKQCRRIDQRFVETGDGDITSTLLPTEAFRRNSPYPFGIDPVS